MLEQVLKKINLAKLNKREKYIIFGVAALLALFIFVVADPHWVNVAWTAGRWVLVTTALALPGLALLPFVRRSIREDRHDGDEPPVDI